MQKRWPLHPMPDEYESLRPWVERLAKAYGVTFNTFCKHALGVPRSDTILLFRDPPEDVLIKLEAGTGITIEQLRDMTLDNVWKRIMRQLEIEYQRNPEAFAQFLPKKSETTEESDNVVV